MMPRIVLGVQRPTGKQSNGINSSKTVARDEHIRHAGAPLDGYKNASVVRNRNIFHKLPVYPKRFRGTPAPNFRSYVFFFSKRCTTMGLFYQRRPIQFCIIIIFPSGDELTATNLISPVSSRCPVVHVTTEFSREISLVPSPLHYPPHTNRPITEFYRDRRRTEFRIHVGRCPL